MRTSKRNTHRTQQRTILSSLLCAWGGSLLGGLPCLLLLSAIAYRSSDPRAGLSAYATLLLVALALSCGAIAARCYRKSPALMGLLSGSGLSILLLGLGIAAAGSEATSIARMLLLLMLPILGLFGGWLGAVRRPRRRRPR